MKLFNFNLSESLVVGLIALLVTSSLLLHYRPRIMFTEDYKFKKFGTGNTSINTLFPFWLVITVLSIAVYVMYYINY
jgi:multisubunit Na+/H+ antiporter MnhB subunit